MNKGTDFEAQMRVPLMPDDFWPQIIIRASQGPFSISAVVSAADVESEYLRIKIETMRLSLWNAVALKENGNATPQ